MHYIPGLVSISFRSLSPYEILKLCHSCCLSAIEWGSDIHVPAGNTDVAQSIRVLSQNFEIQCPEYGSYHNIGCACDEKIENTVASARALGTPVIRLWASNKSRSNMTDDEYSKAVKAVKEICQTYPDLTFCLECHNGTLTEDYHDALTYLSDVNCPNFGMFWQPNQFRDHAYNLQALKALLPYIYSVHVFSWEGHEHYPLDKHTSRWKEYLEILKTAPREKMYLMLEFMHDHKPETLAETAKTLLSWVSQT